MTLSCSCDYFDEYDWYYDSPNDYSVFPEHGRRKRCSCGELIEHGALCTEFASWRSPHDDIEERIHGDEVPLASKFLCEKCSDIYFSLDALGFSCVSPDDNMMDLVKEYHAIYGKKREGV